ncbi:site-2 protease family protein [Dehalococcoides mccartyi]|uniref:site-2 protease family protein n=1 Tax=Dehalococcoides mccartyi TaxID=61435 RepID=UPI0003C8A32E|nr:site-2 protease family protein [Dehalococcoides mccartyi]AHB13434.1 membrane-associated zinc metalloprotease [Dehalococcoides mccartyi GY50]
MKSSFKLGRILGIEIGIHASWLIIFALLSWSLAVAYYPAIDNQISPFTGWALGVLSCLLLFGSVLAHELGHSVIAIRQGIPVKSIVLFIFGGVSNLTKEPDNPGAEFRIAISGPAVSIVLSLVFWLFQSVFAALNITLTSGVFLYLAQINAMLAIFNLTPGFPLDGGRILRAIIWNTSKNLRKATLISARVGLVFAYLLIFGGITAAFLGIGISGLWLALIGWFMATTAQGSYQQTVISEILSAVNVSRVMRREFKTIDPDKTLYQTLHEYILPLNQRALPVFENGQLTGLISLSDIKKIPADKLGQTSVRQVMTPFEKLKTVNPEEHLGNVINMLQSKDINQLPVLSDGKLVGIISRTSLIEYLQMRQEMETNQPDVKQ